MLIQTLKNKYFFRLRKEYKRQDTDRNRRKTEETA